MPTFNLIDMLRRGSVGVMSIKTASGAYRVIGTIRGKRHSRGFRKHLRRMKEGRRHGRT